MVLQCAGDNLRCAGGTAIDHDDHRLAIDQIARTGIEAGDVLRIAAAGRDDLALVEEGVGDGNRLVQQAAGVKAQIEHKALELVGGNLALNVLDRLLQVFEGLFGEGNDPDITDIVLDAVFDGLYLDDIAHDGQLDRLVGALADQGQLDGSVDIAAHLVDGIVQRQAANLGPVDLRDIIASQNTRLESRPVFHGRNDLQKLIFHGDFNAKAAKLALGLHTTCPAPGRHSCRTNADRAMSACH
ncbi:hypothetical protein BKP31_11280 [Streptococcus pneumoniae]|nr:hypothetical protein BKP31_11280 [Streptococcus pneumoniae]